MKVHLVKQNIMIVFLTLSLGILISCNEPRKEGETIIEKTEISNEQAANPHTDEIDSLQGRNVATNSLGKRLFILCASCHNVKKGEPHKVGPNLYGIFGQKAGVKEGFVFSEELIDKDIIWNEETIRKWIENPADYVPGTKMAFVGVKKTAQQDALITYLKEVTKK